MELKPYQQGVINDLEKYLDYLKNYHQADKAFNKYWEDLVLALIGEQLGTKSEMVCGLVLNLKHCFKNTFLCLYNMNPIKFEGIILLLKLNLSSFSIKFLNKNFCVSPKLN